MEEPELILSSLCRTVEHEGHTVRVEIYGTGKNDWILEVIDEEGTSTLWDGEFKTDVLALQEFERTLAEEGIGAIVGEDD